MNAVSRLRQALTLRQAIMIGLVSPLGIAVVVASFTGHQRVVDALLGVLATCAILGILQVRRRVADAQQSHRTLLREVRTVVEQTQRRVVDAVEQERLAGADRHQQVLAELARAHRRHQRVNARDRDAQTAEIASLLQLIGGVDLRAPMPETPQAPLRPADLLAVRRIVDAERPRLVLELGGGTSTVWLAYALERLGGRLVCVDDDAAAVARTRAMLADHGLERVAEVREAPLRPLTIDGAEHSWYDLAAIADLNDIDLVVLGGSRSAGYDDPAIAVLQPRLSPTVTVFRPAASTTDTDQDHDTVRAPKLPAARAESALTTA
jgi:predicted O-methyltransferase YrrM